MRTLKWFKWRNNQSAGVHLARTKSVLIVELWQQNIAIHSASPLPDLKRGKSVYLHTCWRWFHDWHQLVESGFDNYAALQSLLTHSITQQECNLSHLCIQNIEQGRPLAEALLQSFIGKDTHIIQQLQFAERSGALESVLKTITEYYAKQLHHHKQLKKSMAYPLMVMCLGFLLIFGLKFFIFPRFANLYAQTGSELPKLTQIILKPGDFYTQLHIAVFTLLALSLYFLVKTALHCWRHGFYIKHKMWQHSNALSPLFLKTTSQDLSLMLKGLEQNMPIQDICKTLLTSSQCPVRAYLWVMALQFVHRGEPLERIFHLLQLPDRFTSMIAIGAHSGRLTHQLRLIVLQLETTVQQRQQKLFQTIPHIMLGVISMITAGTMAALYMPLFQLGQALS